MPKFHLPLFWIALSALVLASGCSGSKAYTKRGLKMEEVGMMPQAASFYYTAVQKNRPTRMRWLAFNVLANGSSTITCVNSTRHACPTTALEQSRHLKREAYNARVAKLGIRLLFMEFARQAYESVKDAHMDELYQAGLTALETEDFEEAVTQFEEVVRLDPEYEDAAIWQTSHSASPGTESHISHGSIALADRIECTRSGDQARR